MSPSNRISPTPSVRRLPSYLRVLRAAKERGEQSASAAKIAEELGRQSVQVRKDLAITGVLGRPKVGFKIDELIDAILRFLGWDQKTTAYLFGVGNLGTAILNYPGFVANGLEIVEVFDASSKLIGTTICGRTVRAPQEAPTLAREFRKTFGKDVDMGIVTAPAAAAQSIADLLVEADIRAVWNFAPAALDLPKTILCENVKLSESFAALTRRMKEREETEKTS